MKYTWDEIDQLAAILEAELAGKPVDRQEADRLAARLGEICPSIAKTMDMIRARHQDLAKAA